jgi:hypothetical protein
MTTAVGAIGAVKQRVRRSPADSKDQGIALALFYLPDELRYRFQNTKPPELRFSALLSDGTREVRFERVAAG